MSDADEKADPTEKPMMERASGREMIAVWTLSVSFSIAVWLLLLFARR